MQCHSCGTDVGDGQKFCMECGASLRGVADITGEVPVITGAQRSAGPGSDDRTREMGKVPPPPPPAGPSSSSTPVRPPPGPEDPTVPMPMPAPEWTFTGAPGAAVVDTTSELPVVNVPTAPITITTEPPITGQAPLAEQGRTPAEAAPSDKSAGFRLRPLLFLAILALISTIIGVLTTLIEIDPPPDGPVPQYVVNDLGTNNTVAGLLAAGGMVLGSLAWCAGFRWGAGLAGGAGAALAGWVAMVLGVAELPIAAADLAVAPATITRDIGYWALVVAGTLGILVLLGSLVRAGRDGRSGLDPWIAALGAVSFLIAAGGPLIPEGAADWSGNYSSDTLGVDLPTLFFVGRGVQLGLLAVCGVIGMLSVRRFGLGLAVGGALAAGWLLATSATDQTTSPIGPGFRNPPYVDVSGPHAVTTVGFALVGFFALVAIVMALLDADR